MPNVPPGVSVIVGINGLGKTTLLNLIFRMLVGPYDPAKSDRIRPGRKQAHITRIKSVDFFRKRASDQAIAATATTTFLFGDRSIEIERSLYDLSLISYSFDGRRYHVGDTSEDLDERLMDQLCELMGIELGSAGDEANNTLPAHRYDFDFVIRNLIFFLEEKIPLVWNPDGQYVILRVCPETFLAATKPSDHQPD